MPYRGCNRLRDGREGTLNRREKATSRTWYYVWRGVWAMFAILIVAVFVEGWIDLDDVNFDLNALLLTPIRTIMNYQYEDGGLGRYYQGRGPALFQGPIARFGDTAAKAGILALLKSNGYLNLWWGTLATAAATFVGHYPWCVMYNVLSETIKESSKEHIAWWLLQAAFIGYCASVALDTISISLRVVKTYGQAARRVVHQDGRTGLFGRGLKTRIIANDRLVNDTAGRMA
ncbi:hypothetical protein EK21DRAFT_104709 [Setomelanomma holmii]|uniref:Uncharacterized protein n=1 Tax=Setomelanomma holmii TaxID=210430 RepID=A0A9P4GWN8_9PLEO|nr:hypothetical protein EK21DRAFT_104709 [Setomelanomma holmii]